VRFASIDRVRFVGNNENSAFRTAVSNTKNSGCPKENKYYPLGKLSVNQSEFREWTRGISTRAVAGSQIDVSYNSFFAVQNAIYSNDSNQVLSIFGNTFELAEWPGDRCMSALVMTRTRDNGPDEDRVVFYSNRINDRRSESCPIYISAREKRLDTSIAITENRFVRDAGIDSRYAVISIEDTDTGALTGNTFDGTAGSIYLHRDEHQAPVKEWVIAGNKMRETDPDRCDIFLASGVEDSIVGPNQGQVCTRDNSNIIASANSHSTSQTAFSTKMVAPADESAELKAIYDMLELEMVGVDTSE
jgi:hypothetical protein